MDVQRGQRLGQDDHCERETTRLGCYQEVQEAKNHPSPADPNEPSDQGAREVNAQNLEETRIMPTMSPLRYSYKRFRQLKNRLTTWEQVKAEATRICAQFGATWPLGAPSDGDQFDETILLQAYLEVQGKALKICQVSDSRLAFALMGELGNLAHFDATGQHGNKATQRDQVELGRRRQEPAGRLPTHCPRQIQGTMA